MKEKIYRLTEIYICNKKKSNKSEHLYIIKTIIPYYFYMHLIWIFFIFFRLRKYVS